MDKLEKIKLFMDEYEQLCKKYNMMFVPNTSKVWEYSEGFISGMYENVKTWVKLFPKEFEWIN